jgi:L-asparaginase II
MSRLRIEQRRGFAVEAEHEVDAVIATAQGRVLELVGEDVVTTFRSAAKPFQLEVSYGLLSAHEQSILDERDLAIGAASHHGEPVHIEHVQSLLHRFGRGVEHLHCGSHAPTHAESARALFASGGVPCPLHHNCSGKHAFMAAACHVQGFEEDYRPASHPLQQRISERVREASCGALVGSVVDGCGLPCFVLPLSGMASAWAELARSMREAQGSVLGRIGLAMQAHPLLMSGSDAFDGWLTAHANVVAKVGAQGLLCMALPGEGVGVALKVRSGTDVVRPVAALALLERYFPGLLREPAPRRFSDVTNAVGAVVGEIACTT